MGVYVLRVTAKRVKCNDGQEANVAVFAYKPYSSWNEDGQKANSRMHFRSGAASSDQMAKRGNISGRIVRGDENGNVYADSLVYENPNNLGTFYDESVGSHYLPPVEGATVLGALPAREWA